MKKKNDAIYGAIAGDVIGSAYEFRGARFEPIQIFKKCCQFTDDSVLTIAVTDWLTQPGSNLRDRLVQYARKYYQAGYGPSFAKWVMRKNPQPYNSCGNGSAMRVSAVGCVANSFEEALQLAKESAMPTHNHPEGVKGAQATAAAIYLARQGKTKDEIKAKLKELFVKMFTSFMCSVRPQYQRHLYASLKARTMRNAFAWLCSQTRILTQLHV